VSKTETFWRNMPLIGRDFVLPLERGVAIAAYILAYRAVYPNANGGVECDHP
jgi:hypothetical protein